jgi:hypothetical protein
VILTIVLMAGASAEAFDVDKASRKIAAVQQSVEEGLKKPNLDRAAVKVAGDKLVKVSYLVWDLCVTEKAQEFAAIGNDIGDLADAVMGACGSLDVRMQRSIILSAEADETEFTYEDADDVLAKHRRGLRGKAMGVIASERAKHK